MRCCLLAVFLLSCVSSSSFAGDTWPEFRGPTGDGHADAVGLPVTWSETENVRWKTPIHDKGWSSPVIWGKQIWMTTATADGKQLFAVCVDRDTGKIIHDVKVFDVEKPQYCIPFNSYASSTPVLEEGRVYVHFGSAGTACLDTATAKTLWERRDFQCDHFRGAGSSPILFGELLITIYDGFDFQFVVALDRKTGKTVWRKDRATDYTPNLNGDLKKAYATPAVIDAAGKVQLICPSSEETMSYDPLTGTEYWRLAHGGMNGAARPVFAFGKLFLTSGHTRQLLAVRPDGSGNITASHVDWKFGKGIPTRPSLLLVGDLLFLLSDDGIASCVDAKTGKQVWQQRIGGAFSASPLFADGHIYCCSQDGVTHVLEPGREYKAAAVNKLAEGFMASPAVAGSALFLRTKTHLYRVERK